jgi:hypothetical protein
MKRRKWLLGLLLSTGLVFGNCQVIPESRSPKTLITTPIPTLAPTLISISIPEAPTLTLVPTQAPTPTLSEVPVVGSSSGGIVEKLSVESLTLGAAWILVGTVVDLESEWNNERTLIYTHVTVAVEDHIKGALEQTEVNVTVPGGQVGDVGVSVSGVPEFSKGEEVLLFLEENEAGEFHVLGGFQGKFVIYGDKIFVEGKQMPFTDLVNEIQEILKRR